MCLNPPSETVILSVGWAWGPPKVMKNASVRQPLSMEPLPFPCHPDRSEAERRDLRFYGPVLEMFFDGAKRLADQLHTRALWRGVEGPRPCLLAGALRKLSG